MTPIVAIQSWCKNCASKGHYDARTCTSFDCAFHPFRCGRVGNNLYSVLLEAIRQKCDDECFHIETEHCKSHTCILYKFRLGNSFALDELENCRRMLRQVRQLASQRFS